MNPELWNRGFMELQNHGFVELQKHGFVELQNHIFMEPWIRGITQKKKKKNHVSMYIVLRPKGHFYITLQGIPIDTLVQITGSCVACMNYKK